MRFLELVLSTAPRSGPPDPEHRAKVRKAIEAEIASGTLVATGGLTQRALGAARVSSKGGEVTVEDPPDGADWMAAGGYTLIDVPSKEAAIAHAKAKLAFMGDAVVELIQVSEIHPPPQSKPKE
jgi:hypothetical protein